MPDASSLANWIRTGGDWTKYPGSGGGTSGGSSYYGVPGTGNANTGQFGGFNPQFDAVGNQFDVEGWQQRMRDDLVQGEQYDDWMNTINNMGFGNGQNLVTQAAAGGDAGGTTTGIPSGEGEEDEMSRLAQILAGMGLGGGSIWGALGGALASGADFLGSTFGPTGKSNRNLADSLADYNRARIPNVEAQTAGQRLENTQSDIGFRQNLSQRNSLNPQRRAGAGIISDILAGRGPAQTTLNRSRSDNRRTLPGVPGALFSQMLRQQPGR